MRMVDLLSKKRHGHALTEQEIVFIVDGYTAGHIPDYQIAALLMAICFVGMTAAETTALTLAMAHSGELVDLTSIPGKKVDKHSTGGVGDTTTLVVGPIVAACGVPVAKMSGRGLGHTGGTVDKLEAIPGYRTALSRQEFLQIVRQTGISIAGQSGNLAPADKMLYALRDVTATVDSIPLIAASVMSKKIAAGADAIVLDVKTGSGAFCKTVEEATTLAKEMVRIGHLAQRETIALVTDMDTPLGCAVGNSLEVSEAIQLLHGEGPDDLKIICLQLAANMLHLAGKGSLAACIELADSTLENGAALRKFRELVKVQGGDPAYVDNPALFPAAAIIQEITAPQDGYIVGMDSEAVGVAAMQLGAGRRDKDDILDHSAGVRLLKKTGDRVQKGDPLAQLHTNREQALQQATISLLDAFAYGSAPPQPRELVLARIDSAG